MEQTPSFSNQVIVRSIVTGAVCFYVFTIFKNTIK